MKNLLLSVALGSVLAFGIAAPIQAQAAHAQATEAFTPITPQRVMDTRKGGGAFGPGEARTLLLTPPAGATAVALNVTVTEPTEAGYLTVYPAGSAVPTASNLNFLGGQTVANMVTVGLGSPNVGGTGVKLYNAFGQSHVIVDVAGWFRSGFQPVTPLRALDTRQNVGALPAGSVYTLPIAGQFGVPVNAHAVALNVTAVNPAAAGFVTVWPAGSARPDASNINFTPGQTVPNMALVGLSGGSVSIFASAPTDVLVDVAGWFANGSYRPIVPSRQVDTRLADSGVNRPCGLTLQPGERREIGVGAAGQGGAVALNVTVTNPNGNGYLTLWPIGTPTPVASTINYRQGQTVANMALIGTVGGGNGLISLYNYGATTDLIIDVQGWFGSLTPVSGGCQFTPPPMVTTVVDGDTVKLNNGETVRLVGIDAPETGLVRSRRGQRSPPRAGGRPSRGVGRIRRGSGQVRTPVALRRCRRDRCRGSAPSRGPGHSPLQLDRRIRLAPA